MSIPIKKREEGENKPIKANSQDQRKEEVVRISGGSTIIESKTEEQLKRRLDFPKALF